MTAINSTTANTVITFGDLYAAVEARKAARSYWGRGVQAYALYLLDNRENISSKPIENRDHLRRTVLNGADNWEEYSWGGCAYIYDADIAEQLCTPSELKRTDHGRLRPNRREAWLDTQARALYQAEQVLIRAYYRLLAQM